MSLTTVQAQSFTLYGGGVLIGNTSITLSSFLDINGNQLTMSNFGTVGTGTVEPNNGSQEEQIIFTGVTVNSNGTTTLTGVSSVGFESPYTQTSGFTKNHAGLTTFVLSDTAYFYSQYANLQNTQTFTGTNTFNIAPFIPTASSSATTQAASVGYVNAVAISGAAKASTTVFGIVELSVSPATASVPIAVGTNDPRMATASEVLALAGDGGTPSNTNTYITQTGYQIGTESFAVTTGGSTAYAISLSPTPSGYVTGERIYFQTNVASGTAPTINKNSLGAKSLYKWISSGSTPLAIGDLGTNQMAVAEYDGAAYQIISPTANPTEQYFQTQLTNNSSNTGSVVVTHNLGVIPKLIKIATFVGTNTGSASGSGVSVGSQGCAYVSTSGSGTNGNIIFIPSNVTAAISIIGTTTFTLNYTSANATSYHQIEVFA